MQRPPAIGILIPVYNGGKHLAECLHSALAQRGVDFEVWISDDGSTDNSRQVLEQFRGPRIHILPRGPRRGLFANLNRLIAVSQNPFFHILCQDDRLENDCLAKDIQRFSRYPRVGVIFSKPICIDDSGRELYRSQLYDLPNVLHPTLALQHFYYHGCIPGNLSTVALRRSAIVEVGGFDERFFVSGDFDLWTRICRKYDLGIIHSFGVCVRLHENQLSRADSSGPRFVSENRLVRHELVPELPLSVQSHANRFEHRRYGVLDFHYALKSLLKGRYQNAHRVFSSMGLRDTLFGAMSWLVTMNNRFHRPSAQFVLPTNYHVGP